MTATAAKQLPERFGRYVVRDLLGRGGMGAVYLARDELLHRDVAVKTMHAAGLAGPAAEMFTQRFFTEARAASAVAHAHVVHTFDMGVDGDVPYLVMELVRGPSLKDRLRARPLAPEEARLLGVQIARALAAAHALGILHRDVKPANILEAEPGTWKLADFGVARVPDSSLTLTGQFVGSPAYAAPEAIAEGKFTPASDVYGLGATLYEGLAGQAPYGDRDPLALVVAMARETPRDLAELRPDLPPRLRQLVAEAMARDPARRPSAVELAARLAEGLDAPAAAAVAAVPVPPAPVVPPAVPVAAATTAPSVAGTAITPLGPAGRAASAQRSRRWVAIAAVAVFLLVGVAIAASQEGGRSAPASTPASPWPAAGATGLPGAVGGRSPDAEEHWRKANAELARGKLKQAEKHLEAVLERSPGDREAEALLVQVRAERGRAWRGRD